MNVHRVPSWAERSRAVYLIAGGIPYLVLLFLFAALMNHLFAQPDKIGLLYLIVSLLYSIPLFFAQILIAGVSSVVRSADASDPPEDDPPEG